MFKRMMLLVAAVLLCLATAALAQPPGSSITQGQFAVLLASNMNAPAPTGGWSPASATAFLQSQGLVPRSGAWSSEVDLTEGDMAFIFRMMGLNVFTADPDATVTWAKAKELMGRYRDFFRTYRLAHHSMDNTTTTHIYTGVGGGNGGAPEPASPSTP
ncbi:MAG: hypothetical protein ACP5VF_13200 [Acidobacteriota bacterium]